MSLYCSDDDETVDLVAQAIWDSANPFVRWVDLPDNLRANPRITARAVLSALMEVTK